MNTKLEAEKEQLEIFLISDSVGDTAQKVINSVLAQFPDLKKVDIKKFPFIDTKEELQQILTDALKEKAIVVTTLVDEKLNTLIADFSKRTSLRYVDYMTPLIDLIQDKTQLMAQQEPRAQYKLNSEYFNKVEAVEFAVKYDDGKDPKGFVKADYVILGISRTSKTPLSMYLAHKSYKVANLPLILEMSLPKEIYDVPKERLVGLVADAKHILRVRRSRLESLGLKGNSSYVDLKRIESELEHSREVYKKLGARVVDIDGMAVEEIAQLIESGNSSIKNQ